jgi:hypothetical protein
MNNMAPEAVSSVFEFPLIEMGSLHSYRTGDEEV